MIQPITMFIASMVKVVPWRKDDETRGWHSDPSTWRHQLVTRLRRRWGMLTPCPQQSKHVRHKGGLLLGSS